VKGQGTTPVRKNYWCIHYGTETRSNRKLSESIEKDSINPKIIVSFRKRMTPGRMRLAVDGAGTVYYI
jgi:hypothetical protein